MMPIIFILLILSFILSLVLIRSTRNRWRQEIGFRKNNRSGYGYVYFYRGAWELNNLPFVKIGRTNNIKKRLAASKTSNPFGIWLLAVVRVKDDVSAESLIHKKFSKWRISKKNCSLNGRE